MKLAFRLGPLPITIHYTFLLVTVLIALTLGDLMVGTLFVAILTLSVVLHELGHAAVFIRSGVACEIELVALAGLTQGKEPLSPARNLAMTLAGPAVNFAIGLPLWLAIDANMILVESPLVGWAIYLTAMINLYLGIYNMMPVLPLDGGRVLDSLIRLRWPAFGGRTQTCLNLGLALTLAVVALVLENRTLALLMVGLGVFSLVQTSMAHAYGANDKASEVPGMVLHRGWYVRDPHDMDDLDLVPPRSSWPMAALHQVRSDLEAPHAGLMWLSMLAALGSGAWLLAHDSMVVGVTLLIVGVFLVRFMAGGFRIGVTLRRHATTAVAFLDESEKLPQAAQAAFHVGHVSVAEQRVRTIISVPAFEALAADGARVELLLAYWPVKPEFGGEIIGMRRIETVRPDAASEAPTLAPSMP